MCRVLDVANGKSDSKARIQSWDAEKTKDKWILILRLVKGILLDRWIQSNVDERGRAVGKCKGSIGSKNSKTVWINWLGM